MKKIGIVLVAILTCIAFENSTSAAKKETVIYIVRHGEKDTSDPKNADPDLNAEGKERAAALAQVLRKVKLAAVFSTKYKRTQQTAAPAAQHAGVPVQTYEAQDLKTLTETIRSQYENRKVLVTGHSNTILEIAEAFGAKRPVEKLSDEDYDLLLKVTIKKDGTAEITAEHYGKLHHSI
jgi:phosphohistidine phosphatase SixA